MPRCTAIGAPGCARGELAKVSASGGDREDIAAIVVVEGGGSERGWTEKWRFVFGPHVDSIRLCFAAEIIKCQLMFFPEEE